MLPPVTSWPHVLPQKTSPEGLKSASVFLQTQPSAKLCKQEKTLNADVTNKFIFPSLKINKNLLLFLHVPNQDSKRSSFIHHPVNPSLLLMLGDMSDGKGWLPSASTRSFLRILCFLKFIFKLNQRFLSISMVT